MTVLCRTCSQDAEHARSLFDMKGSDVLQNILKLTGIWLSDKPGVPSRICLSCLRDLNKAIAFRERCIKTNDSWFEEQGSQADLAPPLKTDIDRKEITVQQVPLKTNDSWVETQDAQSDLGTPMKYDSDKKEIRVQLVPFDTSQKPKMAVLRKISSQRSWRPDLTDVSCIGPVDPLRCEDIIQVNKPKMAVLRKMPQQPTRKPAEKIICNLVNFFSRSEVASVDVVKSLRPQDISQVNKQKVPVPRKILPHRSRKRNESPSKTMGNLINFFSDPDVPSVRKMSTQRTREPDETAFKSRDNLVRFFAEPEVSSVNIVDPESRIDISQVKIKPINISQKQTKIVPAKTSRQCIKKLDETRFTTIENIIYQLAGPVPSSVDLMDPLRCEDIIKEMNEPLLSNEDPEDSKNQEVIEEDYGNQEVIDEEYKSQEGVRAVPSSKRKKVEFFCDQCGRSFTEKGNFNLHLKRHLGIREYQCKECDRREISQHLLNLHVRIKHRGEKPYVCKYCGQRFNNCLRRLDHERNHKESPDHRPYVCHVCNKAFKKKRMLNHHRVVHTGEQPYHCELCQSHFNRKNSLRTHFKSKHHQSRVEKQAKILYGADTSLLEDK
ncbi:putative zinc finger and SCAN domain-containing protein 5D [Drosophila rhopaloa]|uniref:Uncharacterized protein n=1 Tax=Drosophila rhopaloa TaxID=1041015 RepID=A0ABM5H6H5_DRORH|nr:putative zinc finger and SCAN domain-containing protein 5D [Drosophila rhopaloa]